MDNQNDILHILSKSLQEEINKRADEYIEVMVKYFQAKLNRQKNMIVSDIISCIETQSAFDSISLENNITILYRPKIGKPW